MLFLLYVNDLPSISFCVSTIFASDDKTISFSGLENLITTCNDKLEIVYNSILANRLSMNTRIIFYKIVSNRNFNPYNIYTIYIYVCIYVIAPQISLKFVNLQPS